MPPILRKSNLGQLPNDEVNQTLDRVWDRRWSCSHGFYNANLHQVASGGVLCSVPFGSTYYYSRRTCPVSNSKAKEREWFMLRACSIFLESTVQPVWGPLTSKEKMFISGIWYWLPRRGQNLAIAIRIQSLCGPRIDDSNEIP